MKLLDLTIKVKVVVDDDYHVPGVAEDINRKVAELLWDWAKERGDRMVYSPCQVDVVVDE